MFILRPYQEDAVVAPFNYYNNGGRGNPILALPTATGKSIIIAEFIRRVMKQWPTQRIIGLTHVKELIEQNSNTLREQWPGVPLGIYSAGMNRKETLFPVIYGGIQSVVGNIEAFGHRDLMLVDEAHLISPKEDTEYGTVIQGLRTINPHMRVIGFTATPYRMGQGLITDGGIFTDICFNLCTMEAFNRLIADGYLAMLVPKRTATALDVSRVRIVQGDFAQGALQAAVDLDPITYAACQEICEHGYDRQSWLIFSSGIDHAEHIAQTLQSLGIDAAAVHSKMPAKLATARIKDFRLGKLRAIVNYGKLTTGFDHPPIDLIGDLRPTASTALHVQKLGRGTRPSLATHKENCLVLDFARNTIRLGPINDPVIPRKRVKGAIPGVAPVRICEVCGVYNHARATVCINCGAEFEQAEKLVRTAGTEELVRMPTPIIEWFNVVRVTYGIHKKHDSPPIMKVSYYTPLRIFSEWVCFEHTGWAKKKAWKWWMEHMGVPVAPPTTTQALECIAKLRRPVRIRVSINRKYPEILETQYV